MLLFGIVGIILNLFLNSPEKLAYSKIRANAAPCVVVIDPGHGGSDSGASGKIGKKRVYEKDIALAIAVRLSHVLADKKYWSPLGRRIKVILTRKKDVNTSLAERARQAHENKADLFLSIHMNSDPKGQASGLETYFLNNTNDKSSDKLAQIENKDSKPEMLLLKSIAVDATVESSKNAADILHASLLNRLELDDILVKDRGVKQSLLYVLLDAQTPAVLTEVLFMSNKQDLSLISNPENRQKIAEGLAYGILRFLASR